MVLSDIEVAPLIQYSLLHVEAVRVSVEDPFIIEIMSLPVSHNLIALREHIGEGVEVYIKFDSTEITIKSHLDNGLSLVAKAQVEGHPGVVLAFGDCAVHDVGVGDGEEQVVDRSENVST